jgi:hypothetical protein
MLLKNMPKCYDCMYLVLLKSDSAQFKCSKRRFIINHGIDVDFECDDFQDLLVFLEKYEMNNPPPHTLNVND